VFNGFVPSPKELKENAAGLKELSDPFDIQITHLGGVANKKKNIYVWNRWWW